MGKEANPIPQGKYVPAVRFGDLVFLQTAPHSGHQLFFLAIAQFSVHSLLNFLHQFFFHIVSPDL